MGSRHYTHVATERRRAEMIEPALLGVPTFAASRQSVTQLFLARPRRAV